MLTLTRLYAHHDDSGDGTPNSVLDLTFDWPVTGTSNNTSPVNFSPKLLGGLSDATSTSDGYVETYAPIPVVAAPGSTISLQSILEENYGSTLASFQGIWIEYYGASWLASESFSYWNPGNPSVTTWSINGTPTGASTNAATRNVVFVPVSEIGDVTLQVGNDIAGAAWIDAVSGNFNHWFALNTISPNLESSTAAAGAPNPSDVVAAAERYAAEYSGVPDTSDCYNIAADVAAAAGAPLPIPSGNDDPTQNVSGGFWRVIYRGSDPNPVANWQTLVQPGDMVRMVWTNGTPQAPDHTTTVLSVNANGSITVFDNSASSTGMIGIHTVNYDTATVPSSITIYRLSPDHLYLINGVTNETLYGSPYNNEFNAVGGDTVNCGPANDIVNVGTGTIDVNGGGGSDTVVFASLSSAAAQFTGSTGQALSVIDGIVFDPSGQAVTISWSGGSETLNKVSAVQFTDQTLGFASVAPTLTPAQINEIYEGVLQRAATSTEVTTQLIASGNGAAGVVAAAVDSAEAQFNVYPIIQIIQLATGILPSAHQLAAWVPYIEENGLLTGQAQTNALLDQMAEAFVASDNFAKVYNPPFTGTDVNPNSLVTAGEMQIIIKAATGIAATQAQVNVWVGLGLTIDQVFVDFALGDQYTAFSQAGNQQYLTTVADTAAGIQASGAIVGSANASLVAHA